MKRLSWIVITLFFAGCGSSNAPVPTGKNAPDSLNSQASANAGDSQSSLNATQDGDVRLAIVSYDGIQQHIARNHGKVVVMDAWSTSCAPCVKEFHNLVELHHKYGPEKLACISLSFDYEGLGTPEEQQGPVLKFLRDQGATFDNLMSTEESDVLYRKFKLAAVPAVFVYDRAGQLRKRFDNEQAKSKAEAFTYEQVGQLVAELLQEDAPGEPSGT